MKHIYFGIGLLIAALVAGGSFVLLMPMGSSVNQKTAQTGVQVFSDSPYYRYAYVVSTDNLTPIAKLALSGFDLTKKTLSDGSVQYDLATMKGNYVNQTYVVKSGQKLYFIDTELGEDGVPSYEGSLGDDFAVVVDQKGYVVA